MQVSRTEPVDIGPDPSVCRAMTAVGDPSSGSRRIYVGLASFGDADRAETTRQHHPIGVPFMKHI